jgi:aspartyl-tRNA(Asn)/glutamyl-tRNA(Gln) amidotransferase subunit A
MVSLQELTIHAAAAAVRNGDVTAERLTQSYVDRIEKRGQELGAFLAFDASDALEQARAVDRTRAAGKALGALAGVPMGLKDNLCMRGLPTTCASKILEGYRPPYEAHVVERLREAGAVLIGKLNMDEFAMGSSNESSAYGVVRNPWDLARAPGGSSGGSAAATSARLVLGALGSDTGGSVRQPAAFCGVTAMKPTYGRVSRYGVVAFASSLDQVGPITRTARDTATVLSVIAGRDERDPTTSSHAVQDYVAACGEPIKGLRVGVLREALEGCDPDVVASIERAIGALRDAGCEVVDVQLPNAKHALAVYYIIAPAEASSNLARFDGMRYGPRVEGGDLRETYAKTRRAGFGPEVRRRIMLGTYALSAGYYDAFYIKASKVRTLIRRDYEQAFTRCDVILTPTSPTPAFKLGEVKDPLAMYKQDIFTLPAPLAGVPALSMPAGLSRERLPLGLQLEAAPFKEDVLVRVAHALEERIGLLPAPAGYES